MGQWVPLRKEKVVKQPRMGWTGQKTPRPLHVTPLPGKSGHATLDPLVSICADREQKCSVGSKTAEQQRRGHGRDLGRRQCGVQD